MKTADCETVILIIRMFKGNLDYVSVKFHWVLVDFHRKLYNFEWIPRAEEQTDNGFPSVSKMITVKAKIPTRTSIPNLNPKFQEIK